MCDIVGKIIFIEDTLGVAADALRSHPQHNFTNSGKNSRPVLEPFGRLICELWLRNPGVMAQNMRFNHI